jgi:hypothetical protein
MMVRSVELVFAYVVLGAGEAIRASPWACHITRTALAEGEAHADGERVWGHTSRCGPTLPACRRRCPPTARTDAARSRRAASAYTQRLFAPEDRAASFLFHFKRAYPLHFVARERHARR